MGRRDREEAEAILAKVTGISIDPDSTQEGVMAALEVYQKGKALVPKRTKHNVTVILERDTRWAGRIWANELDGLIYKDAKPITDEDMEILYEWIYLHYDLHASETHIERAIRLVAHRNRRHPIREYLQGLTWDGTPRLGRWLANYCGASVAPLIGRIGTCWAISAVARVMDPGCKVHTCLIFKSGQGSGKSSTFELMAIREEWFSDSDIDMGSKDKYQSIQGVWIYELAELSSIRKAENTAVKSFITSRKDRYRPAFDRFTRVQPRQTIFVGTTNEEAFLTDPSGSRRFWPVTVGRIDQAGLLKVRDQLWAEAVHRYDAGEQWWLTDSEEEQLRIHNSQYRQADIWEDAVETWASKRAAPFTQAELMEDALGREMKHANGRDEIRTRSILQALGYETRQMRLNGRKARWWFRGSYRGSEWGTAGAAE